MTFRIAGASEYRNRVRGILTNLGSQMRIHFTVEDHNGDPVPGIPVQVAVENPGHLLIEETDADGKATIEIDAHDPHFGFKLGPD